MKSPSKRIRREYAPLNIAVSLTCTTPTSPVTQLYDPVLNEFQPDRGLTPTVLYPQVCISSADGTYSNHIANGQLSECKWFMLNAEGELVDVSTSYFKNSVTMTTSGVMKGALSIKYNFEVGAQIPLVFQAKLTDTRTGLIYDIKTEQVILSTTAVAEDEITAEFYGPSMLIYNPLLDAYAQYEYASTHGGGEATRTQTINKLNGLKGKPTGYMQQVIVALRRGGEDVDPNLWDNVYSLKICRVKNGNVGEPITETDNEIILRDEQGFDLSYACSGFYIDMRLVDHEEYLIKVVETTPNDIRCVAQLPFSAKRILPNFNISPMNGTAINPSDTFRYDECHVSTNSGETIQWPEYAFDLKWMTDSCSATNVVHCYGEHAVIDLSKTGMGDTYDTNYLDVYVDAEYKPTAQILQDGNGVILIDGEPPEEEGSEIDTTNNLVLISY